MSGARIERLKFNPGVACGEPPVGTEAFRIAAPLPGADLRVHDRRGAEPSFPEALSRQDAHE